MYLIVSKPANINMLKVNDRNTRKTCEIFSKLIIMSLSSMTSFWCVFVNFERFSHKVIVFPYVN